MPLMRNNAQGGAIVATAPASVARAAAPGFVQLVQAAAREGAAHNIRINAIAPQSAMAGTGLKCPGFPISPPSTARTRPRLRRWRKRRFRWPVARRMPTSRLLLTLFGRLPLSGATLVVDGAI